MMRLDKFLAHVGFGSRSEVKQLVRSKQVEVNGVICYREDSKIKEDTDQIKVKGQLVKYQKHVYFMLNKPQGVISATEDDVHQTVMDLIDDSVHGLFPVGRLDKDTEGLLLITNDGQLAHQLLSPKKHVPKCYYVEISQSLQQEHIVQLRTGIQIGKDEFCQPAEVEILSENSLYLTIVEGKYHQVKRMMLACDNQVTYLKRISMGTLQLDKKLKQGQYRVCTKEEIENLRYFHLEKE